MTLFDKLLLYYKINKDDYAFLKHDVTEGDIASFHVFNHIDEVSARIKQAIARKEKILVYGDYDADGIFATSILIKTLRELKADVSYYLPSRYLKDDGYGLNKEKVKIAHEKGFKLIITVDNGISAFDAIKEAKELNIDLIITDHHEYKTLPEGVLILHPRLSTLSVTTSGACVAFYLSLALLNRIDPYFVILAGDSLLSDVMPLIKENRQLVKLAIKYLNKGCYPQFNLLSDKKIYDETTLGLIVNPKINTLGRIAENKEVNLMVKYFTSDTYRDYLTIKEYVENMNIKRKELTEIALRDIIINNDDPSICLSLNTLNGLAGAIAGRLLNQYKKPALIFAPSLASDELRGSFRSKKGSNIIDFINENSDLFVSCGGHQFAAGVTIKKDNFNLVKERFFIFCKTHPFVKEEENIEINLDDLTFLNYELIRSFAPFGEGWPEPTFIIKNVALNRVERVGRNHEHLKINVTPQVAIIGYHFPFNTLANKTTIDLIGRWRMNEFKARRTLNFVLEN